MRLLADTVEARARVLAQHGFNLDLIPSRLVLDDYQTDSLMHGDCTGFPLVQQDGDGELDERLAAAFQALFGISQVLSVAQGRLAEALLVNALITSGECVLGSAPFPTLQAHLQLRGATYVTVSTTDANGDFRADLDCVALEQAIKRVGRHRIPFLLVEACTNANGGAPVSVDNLRAVKAVAGRYGIPLMLDATRVFSNACLIREHASEWRGHDELGIVQALCALVDGVLLSATKEMPTTIGGFLALRDRSLFERCRDQALIFGTGLDLLGKRRLLTAMHEPNGLVKQVRSRIDQVRRFHARLQLGGESRVGAHGVFLVGGAPMTPMHARAFLNHLYVGYGVRGALNPGGSAGHGDALVRFALGVPGKDERVLETAAICIREALREADQHIALEEVHRPAGLAGGMLATYRKARSVQP
ncbi:beta-eliminating lyase-related protein [Pseudomonas mosselii]|uniref:Aromatic amino acid beta-eliminating lyase/threonine aldolase domain-containing protein n=1 Tax=Pseudomonas mosselii TaxID=78327 RepID=A0ABX9B2F2_9PSED|nr:beta-eliminating lyase-related protein [Pseudomonas mosselii]MDH0627796.1 beta-eliminating lyase-related protein [Pseudomonas mosselii]MDH0677879.1 beta-eliminating lyase-related protein [Pseudomonas mosselii]MDH0925958.1 beta-eliminating lyase-related protein [Pseudomonas mosselii]MDH1134419.1 beta-eliminating lyase-related protein [Pseudomonas mosselii]MDH1140638.1 beta-eliminating lyase-related protein [Pseudomonas mosselii]